MWFGPEHIAVAGSLAQVLGTFLTAAGIFYAVAQLRHSVRVSRATFLLELERLSRVHDAVHAHLRPGGLWAEEGAGPQTAGDWIQVEDYMGFFEHCEVLIRQGSLDAKVFESLFAYRLRNLLANEFIVHAKLHAEREHWQLFWALLKRFGLEKAAEIKPFEYYASMKPPIDSADTAEAADSSEAEDAEAADSYEAADTSEVADSSEAVDTCEAAGSSAAADTSEAAVTSEVTVIDSLPARAAAPATSNKDSKSVARAVAIKFGPDISRQVEELLEGKPRHEVREALASNENIFEVIGFLSSGYLGHNESIKSRSFGHSNQSARVIVLASEQAVRLASTGATQTEIVRELENNGAIGKELASRVAGEVFAG
ncbi:MAG: hypothetical protein ACLPX9_15330 [Rhodomicrobium sp.]